MKSHQKHHAPRRAGFTLIEMLVVITIIVVLASISAGLYTGMANADRIRSSSRQIQSYLEGARDRAILSQMPRGVRFLTDSANPATVRTMIFIGQTDPIKGLLVVDPDKSKDYQLVELYGLSLPSTDPDYAYPNQRWDNLYLRGLLKSGARITIYNTRNYDRNGKPDPPQFQQIRVANASFPTLVTSNRLRLADDVMNYAQQEGSKTPANPDYQGPYIFELELAPAVLPNQEPVELGPGIAIDVDITNPIIASGLPSSWATSGANMDIMFSPRGTVTGQEAAAGLIHFMLRDVVDIENKLPVSSPAREGDELIVSVFTRTGHISSHPVYNEDANANGVPDMPSEDSTGNDTWDGPGVDPFYFAETGEVAQ
jgi:prepilin-type N-terminal cleavage/methylation domain-containing protein